MENNKTGKYFKYAIGEIILVVIGILIALQINNWNEDRVRENLEIATLLELKDNLRADIRDFQEDMRVYKIISNSSDIIVDFIDGKIPYNDSLNKHLGIIPTQGVFTVNKASYENLKIIGIKLIRNDSLRGAISELYEGRYNYVENYMKIEYQFDHQKFSEFYLKEMEEFSFYNYAIPINYKRLVKNQEFRNLIIHKKLKIQTWYKTQYNLNIKKARKLIEMVDKEIVQ